MAKGAKLRAHSLSRERPIRGEYQAFPTGFELAFVLKFNHPQYFCALNAKIVLEGGGAGMVCQGIAVWAHVQHHAEFDGLDGRECRHGVKR